MKSYSYWQNIYSPNYPQKYNNNENVAWKIHNSYGTHIVLEVVEMYIEHDYDRVQIFDGPSSTGNRLIASLTGFGGTVYGDWYAERRYFSTSNDMYVLFTSDHSITQRGFQFRYRGTYENQASQTLSTFTLYPLK